jgi:hypothetical protein
MAPAIMAAVVAALTPAVAGAAVPTSREQIITGLNRALTLTSPRVDGLVTVSDNNLWVQCLSSHYFKTWRCEAAGLEGQPWLRHVLTVERQDRLATLGFAPDNEVGNFVARVASATATSLMADRIIAVLTQAYGAKAEDLTVSVDTLRSARCHTRLRADADRGGSILTPSWGFAKDAAEGCRVGASAAGLNYDDPAAVLPPATGIDLEARYLSAMTAALQDLEASPEGKDAYVIFAAGPAYVQCLHDIADKQIYCEAASDDAVGAPVRRILTPDHLAKLADAGFEPPGKVMNFHRFYAQAQYDATAVAKALLSVLRDAYDYGGAPPLMLTTASEKERPL